MNVMQNKHLTGKEKLLTCVWEDVKLLGMGIEIEPHSHSQEWQYM